MLADDSTNEADSQSADPDGIEEIVVTADPRSLQAKSAHGSVTVLDADVVSKVRATHPNEILSRVPGVWVVRGSGQEHLTGMRSAVLAGPGACGAFLLLEDNVPIRPVGFCNVNGLFELNLEQADQIEVLRGPASSLYGGNALHGVINVRPFLASNYDSKISFESGPHDYLHARVDYRNSPIQFKFLSTTTNGYRHATGYGQQKLNLRFSSTQGDWEGNHIVSATVLNQETGGYVRGFEAYRDSELRQSNPNPEAYRDAKSFRTASHWSGPAWDGALHFAPYLRRSVMQFRQHFLPGQPTEKNSQSSMGVVGHWFKDFPTYTLTVGSQIEWMQASLLEQQIGPTTGSAFLVATRPEGIHYNFGVNSTSIAVFNNLIYPITDVGELSQSLRVEQVQYEYDNRHLVGNTKDDGTPCGFGGCLYTRPADRSDTYSNIAARFGFRHWIDDQSFAYGLLSWGYRPPQTTELYRLQSGQSVADLDSERLRSIEIGVDMDHDPIAFNLLAFSESNQDLVFRDAEGMNVSDGEITSFGLEVEMDYKLNSFNELSLSGTLASHEYSFTRNVARGESIVDGNEVDSAPSVMVNFRWVYERNSSNLEFEVNRVGSHYINAANSAEYEGHTVANLRWTYQLGNRWTVLARATNILDVEYANRADFAFGSYRYFPGTPRQLYVGIEFKT